MQGEYLREFELYWFVEWRAPCVTVDIIYVHLIS